jgi:hypothetical protein
VIDLTDVNSPKVLGYVKLPGYSTYLHPISNTTILGFGRDTYETKDGFIKNGGLKAALFDVSNPSEPKVLSEVIIGDETTSSDLQYDHKSFVYDPEKKLFLIPTNSYNYKVEGSSSMSELQVIKVDSNSLEKLDRVTLQKSTEKWGYVPQISKLVYSGSNIFAYSYEGLILVDYDNFNFKDSMKFEVKYIEPTPYYDKQGVPETVAISSVSE